MEVNLYMEIVPEEEHAAKYKFIFEDGFHAAAVKVVPLIDEVKLAVVLYT